MEMLVSTEWLADAIAADEARVLDASWFLPDQARNARAEYLGGHIPGARFFDLDAIADRANPLPHMMPDAAQFARQLGALGVSEADRIVVYDDTPLHSAARAWWMLRTMGATQVALLDGGLAKWRAEGRALEAGEAAAIDPVAFRAEPTPGAAVDLAAMRATDAQIVDARSPARFAGAEPEPRAGVVPGHIPGSRNLHYARLFDADGTWKRGDALEAAFRDAGVDIDRPIVTTCGSGVTAAVLLFGLALLGRGGALYDGSWSEWGSVADTPKETGE